MVTEVMGMYKMNQKVCKVRRGLRREPWGKPTFRGRGGARGNFQGH